MEQQDIDSSQVNKTPEYQQSQQLPKKKKPHMFFQMLIGLAIAILVSLFYFYSYQLIFEKSKFKVSDYQKASQECYSQNYDNQVYTKDQCFSEGGVWYENENNNQYATVLVDGAEVKITGRCDFSAKVQKCSQAVAAKYPSDPYSSSNGYENNKFLGALVFGIVLIIISFFIKRVLAISIGFSLGGVFMIVSGIFHFWSSINGLFRVVILAVGLAIIIFLAIKKLKSD